MLNSCPWYTSLLFTGPLKNVCGGASMSPPSSTRNYMAWNPATLIHSRRFENTCPSVEKTRAWGWKGRTTQACPTSSSVTCGCHALWCKMGLVLSNHSIPCGFFQCTVACLNWSLEKLLGHTTDLRIPQPAWSIPRERYFLSCGTITKGNWYTHQSGNARRVSGPQEVKIILCV